MKSQLICRVQEVGLSKRRRTHHIDKVLEGDDAIAI